MQVSFTDGTYRVGDYWVIPARAATGTIDWPPYPAEDDAAIPPFGWGRRFAPLALARRSGQGLAGIVDMRALFPPLTEIEASDVWFDDSNCALEAETVQDALDALCRRGRGKCTVFASTAAELRAGVEALAPGTHAHICLGAGMFQLQETLRIAGLGHVTVSGSGPQSLVTVGGDEAALLFENCASLRLADFAVNGGRVGSSGRLRGRLGAVTVRDCGEVSVERVNAQCRAGPYRHASCIAVYGLERSGPVRVRDCRLTVGQGQTGVQIIGSARALVENNRIVAARAPGDVVVRRLRADGGLVALIARSMVNLAAAPDAAAGDGGGDDSGGRVIRRGGTLAIRGRAGALSRDIAQPVEVNVRGAGGVRINAHPSVSGAVTEYFERPGTFRSATSPPPAPTSSTSRAKRCSRAARCGSAGRSSTASVPICARSRRTRSSSRAW